METTRKKKKKRIRDRRFKKQELPEIIQPKKIPPGMMGRLDGRTNLFKRFRDEYFAIVDDLGGEADLPTIVRSDIERYVFLNELIRSWELQFAENPEQNPDLIGKLTQATNARSGLARDLLKLTKKRGTGQTLQAIVGGGN